MIYNLLSAFKQISLKHCTTHSCIMMSVCAVHYTAQTEPSLLMLKVGCAAHNTTDSNNIPHHNVQRNVIVSIAGTPVQYVFE